MKDALLPDSFEEFRSVKFWDGFFESRGQKPFEWYGDWRQLRPFLERDCSSGKEVLVVGCGNSELSANLYDHGCQNITNVDFSKPLIASMMKKHLRQRPRMKWKVGDMTDLKFPDDKFQIVVDKGGLDALMGEESEGSTTSGKQLLNGVSRVTSPGGVYLCISLAQSHVLSLVLEHFKRGWLLELHAIPPSPDMAHSALQPIFIRAQKRVPGQEVQGSNVCSIARAPRAPNAEQLDEICQILEAAASSAVEESARGEKGGAASPVSAFDGLDPGQRRVVALPYKPGISSPGVENGKQARFTATILDVQGNASDAAVQKCCVFLVPQGRESEWLFASEEGQWQVAGQCRCCRVILVTLGRSHHFTTQTAVQAELSPLVVALAPLAVRDIPGAIPIMTTQEGVGRRRVLATVTSPISGQIIVEDVAVEGQEEPAFARRLVFTEISSLIQSEARLVACKPESSGLAEKTPAKNGKKGAKKAQAIGSELPQLELDDTVLAMDYHKQIVAGLLASGCLGRNNVRSKASVLVIGLGGGGLPVFLSRYLQLHTRVAELDPEVAKLAAEHFRCCGIPALQVEVKDGLVAMQESEAASYDAIILDAGSNDAALAISCPPAAFLEASFLEQASKSLKPTGSLVINCVTRSDTAITGVLKSLQVFFGDGISFLEVEEDVNRVIFAPKSGTHVGKKLAAPAAQIVDAHVQELDVDQKEWLIDELSSLNFNKP